MKRLREGYTTGACAAGASLASVLWQTTGSCPEWVELVVPAGKNCVWRYSPVRRTPAA